MDLQQRQGGKLPIIDIEGTPYFVEIRLRELRADFRLMSRINLDKCETAPDGESYRFAYDTATKQMVTIDPGITEWPENVKVLEVPGDIKLDPYSLARDNGMDPVEFVKKNPFPKELKAKEIQLAQTGFPEIMDKNRKAKQGLLQKKDRPLGKNNRNRIR